MRIYLDGCCLNRPFDDQRQERVRLEAEAVLAILRRIDAGVWQLIGSGAVAFEIGLAPDAERRQRVLSLAQLAGEQIGVDAAVKARAHEWVAAGIKPLDARLQQFDPGKGDYTQERHAWLDGLTLDQVVQGVEEARPKP